MTLKTPALQHYWCVSGVNLQRVYSKHLELCNSF